MESMKGWRTIVCVVLAGVAAGVKAIKGQIGLADVPDETFDQAVQWLLGGGAVFLVAKLGRIEEVLKQRFPFMLCIVLLPLCSLGCMDAPEPVLKGHDTAAECVRRAQWMNEQILENMAVKLRQERQAHAEFAMKKSYDQIRLEAAKNGGKIDAEEAIKFIQGELALRDQQLAEIEKLITNYMAAKAAADRESVLALQLMGELRRYDAAGVDPAKTAAAGAAALGEFVPGIQ